jgi:hypothetical protein
MVCHLIRLMAISMPLLTRATTANAGAENIMTISNSRIRGVGTDSLAISDVEPGTCSVFSDVDAPDSGGLTVQDRTDSCTHYIPIDKVATSSMLNETDLDISSVIALIIGITTGPHNEITVMNLSPSDIDNDYIQADTDKTMTVEGFNSVDVTTRGE